MQQFSTREESIHPAAKELNDLAAQLAKARQFESAIIVTKRALAFIPGSPGLLNNLGTYYWSAGHVQEAYDHLWQAVRVDPGYAWAWGNLGLAAADLGLRDEALTAFNTALVTDPELHGARFDRGLFFLRMGDYARGFLDYEARIQHRGPPLYPRMPAPIWQGEDLSGKTIYVENEQGVGDTILFSRFLPWLAAQAAKVYLCLPHLVVPLMWEYRRYVDFVPTSTPIPKTDYSMFYASMAHRCGAVRDALLPDPGLILECVTSAEARGMTVHVPEPDNAAVRPFRVGICWTGNPNMEQNDARSILLVELARLAIDPRVFLYSLQVGPSSSDVQRLGLGDVIYDPSEELGRRGYVATAIAMRQLDFVVTCCTSVAHLAGALGIPAWTVLCRNPYWVWGQDGSSSPWWPSLRLFRQREHGAWRQVVDEIRMELSTLIDARDGADRMAA